MPGVANNSNGWAEYKRLVVKELEDLSKWCSDMQCEINKINIKVAVLMTKVALIAALFGAIGAGIISFIVRYTSNR